MSAHEDAPALVNAQAGVRAKDGFREVDLLGEETGPQKATRLFYLTRESLKRRQLEELWKAKQATSPRSLGDIVTSDAVVTAIRRELWRKRGHRIDGEDLEKILRETVLRPECFI